MSMPLDLRVVTIVVSSLFLVIALSWIDALEVISGYVYFSENKNELHQRHTYEKKIFSTIFITILALALIIGVLLVYGQKYGDCGKRTIPDD